MVISRMKTGDVTDAARIEEKIFSMPWSEQSFLEALEQEYTMFFAAKEGEHCVGYIGAYFAADEAEITNVAVDMEYRRRHIAEALVAEMQKEAAKRGTRSIFLEVRCSNTGAIALYQKMRFSICGTRRGFYEKPKEDAYVMVYTPEISTTTGED